MQFMNQDAFPSSFIPEMSRNIHVYIAFKNGLTRFIREMSETFTYIAFINVFTSLFDTRRFDCDRPGLSGPSLVCCKHGGGKLEVLMGERIVGLGRWGALEGLIKRAGGCAVVDGGLATQLENHGANINDPLWSALCLVTNPNLIKQVHLEYLGAGAEVLGTSSYQATLPGFTSRGFSIEQGESLLQKSVKLACEARDSFWENVQNCETLDKKYNRALVAACIGSYGAYLADGSEYSGDFGSDVTLDKLKDFHRRRLQVLVEAGPDLLAFETIPNKLEAQACVELLEEEDVQVPSWLCFSAIDGIHVSSGETFRDCLDAVEKSEKVVGVGINCSPPNFIEDLIRIARKATEKAIVVYPNSGEIWDGKAKQWLPAKCSCQEQFEILVKRWREAGANLIGGCCRTTPTTIQAISKALKDTL